MRTSTRILMQLALMGASVLLCAGVGELFLRLFPSYLSSEAQLRLHWRAIVAQPTRSVADPYLGFHYPAHTSETISVSDASFHYTTDENGFRNASPWPAQAEIVAVGDSQTFGYGAEDDQSWPHQLGAQLAKSRVINLGLNGAAPQQYLRVLEKFGLPLQPKVVVFALFPGNDLSDAALWEAWQRAGSPGNYDVWRFFGGDVPGKRHGLERLLGWSHLAVFLREAQKDLGSVRTASSAACADGRTLRLAGGMLRAMTEHAHSGDPDFDRVIATVRQTRELAESHGAKLLVLLVPTKESVYLPLADASLAASARTFVPELEQAGIDVADATPAFQERAKRGECPFLSIDGHPNAQGYALLADVVRERLASQAQRYGLRDWE